MMIFCLKKMWRSRELEFVGTQNQLIDNFTKALPVENFFFFMLAVNWTY